MIWSVARTPELAQRVAMGDFSPEVRDWLCKAFSSYLAEGKSIENALGLDRVSLIRCRDEALREAARLLMLERDDDLLWPVAQRMAAAVAYHNRLRRDPQTPIESYIASAFASGQRVPESVRGLYDLIR